MNYQMESISERADDRSLQQNSQRYTSEGTFVNSRDVQNSERLTIALFTGEVNLCFLLRVALNNSKASSPMSLKSS